LECPGGGGTAGAEQRYFSRVQLKMFDLLTPLLRRIDGVPLARAGTDGGGSSLGARHLRRDRMPTRIAAADRGVPGSPGKWVLLTQVSGTPRLTAVAVNRMG
jgi:hypothetical protein